MTASISLPHGFVVAVLNQKGGTGKSTISTCLAAAGHQAGRRTLLVDMDPQGSSFDWGAARGPGSPLEGLVVTRVDRAKALALPQFVPLTLGYDLIVCDGPPRLGDLTSAAAVLADVVLIPMRAGGFDWWAAAEVLKTLDAADATRQVLGRDPVRRVFLLNGATANTRATRYAEHAFKALGDMAPTLHSRHAFQLPQSDGHCCLTVDPKGKAAGEILAVYDFLMTGPKRITTGART